MAVDALGDNLCDIRLVGILDAFGGFELWKRDELVVCMTVTNVRRELQMQGVGCL